MKKTFLIFICAVFALSLSLCAFALELNVYNWGEYISDGSEGSVDVNAEFEKYYEEKYGEKISVNYTTYASNEDMYAKLKSGASSYDVIFPSDYMAQRMAEENMLLKIDYSKITNYINISPDFKGLFYDEAEEYTVPYTYGKVGIIYNTKAVNEADTGTWALMWNEQYKGQILQFGNPRDAFGCAMYKLGIDVNTTSEEEWRTALAELKTQKGILQGYVMDEVFNKMESGEAQIAAYYAGDFLSMYDNNEDLAFYYPSEGTNIFIDVMCIPAGAQNIDLAHEYIDFMLSEDIAIANAEYICYASPNMSVYKSETYREDMGEMAMEILYPESNGVSFKDEFNKNAFRNLPSDTLELENYLWEELKIDSSMGYSVYYICGAVVLAIVIFAVVSAVRKKKKSEY